MAPAIRQIPESGIWRLAEAMQVIPGQFNTNVYYEVISKVHETETHIMLC